MDKTYCRIDGLQYRGVYAVGDLHGCFDLLDLELEKAGFDPEQDLLLSVGDLVDRGPKSLECLELITKPWFKSVRGNHEMLMFSALNQHKPDSQYWWEVNGGKWFYESLNDQQRERVRSLSELIPDLPFIIELTLGYNRVVIAHADYPGDKYEFGAEADPAEVIWSRKRVNNLCSGISGAELFIFGHTPVKQPLRHENLMYIDTGAFRTGVLTLVKLL